MNEGTPLEQIHEDRKVLGNLRELTLVPFEGLCNRLRAIASARRLCQMMNAKCSVVWEWGDFESFFRRPDDLNIIRKPSGSPDKSVRHKPFYLDPTRTVDISARHVQVFSPHIFWGSHEPKITLKTVLPYVPAPSAPVTNIVDEFARNHLGNAVGVHIRRTDNEIAIERSPDGLFVKTVYELVSSGNKIFLATDNCQTEKFMKTIFGSAVITYPKRENLAQRWPRPFSPLALEDDLVEMLLLSRTKYVLGSFWSSYSGMAIALNGSPKSRILKSEEKSVRNE